MSSKEGKQIKKASTLQKLYVYVLLIAFIVGVNFSNVSGEPFYEINGYYLGATPEELGVAVSRQRSSALFCPPQRQLKILSNYRGNCRKTRSRD